MACAPSIDLRPLPGHPGVFRVYADSRLTSIQVAPRRPQSVSDMQHRATVYFAAGEYRPARSMDEAKSMIAAYLSGRLGLDRI